jgi:hypothetical protein
MEQEIKRHKQFVEDVYQEYVKSELDKPFILTLGAVKAIEVMLDSLAEEVGRLKAKL